MTSSSRFRPSGLSSQLPSSGAVSSDFIVEIATDVLMERDLRQLGMDEEELVAEIAEVLAGHDIWNVSLQRIRDVIENNIDEGENFLRLLGPTGPIALDDDINAVFDGFGRDDRPMRLDDLVEGIHRETPYYKNPNLLSTICDMVELGYLRVDSKMHLTLLPGLIYIPDNTNDGVSATVMEEEEFAPIPQRMTAKRRSSDQPVMIWLLARELDLIKDSRSTNNNNNNNLSPEVVNKNDCVDWQQC